MAPEQDSGCGEPYDPPMTSESELFAEIAQERIAFAELVAGLDADQLAAPSLCGAWTVHDVSAHLILPMATSLPTMLGAMVRHRGSFDRANDTLSRQLASRRSGLEIAQTLRERATFRFTPPGHGPTAPLTDLLVHGQDVRRPLGIAREFSEHRLTTALDFLASPKSKLGFTDPKRTAGLRFVADDLDWSAGDGPEVTGPAEALMLVYTGRPAALADVSGEGAEILAGRLR